MAVWTIAAVAATIFMSLYESQDFAERLNFKIPPSMDFRLVIVGVMVFSCIFCYLWEVRVIFKYWLKVTRLMLWFGGYLKLADLLH